MQVLHKSIMYTIFREFNGYTSAKNLMIQDVPE